MNLRHPVSAAKELQHMCIYACIYMDGWQFVYVCESVLIVSAENVYIRVYIDGCMAVCLCV